jgi:hypothetical protein
MTNPVSFRLTDETLSLLLIHASDLSASKGRTVDRTEALEDIIHQWAKKQKTLVSKIKRKLQPHSDTSLSAFLEAQKSLADDQLQEALH